MPLRTTSASSRGNGIKKVFTRIGSIFVTLIIVLICLVPIFSASALSLDDKVDFIYEEWFIVRTFGVEYKNTSVKDIIIDLAQYAESGDKTRAFAALFATSGGTLNGEDHGGLFYNEGEICDWNSIADTDVGDALIKIFEGRAGISVGDAGSLGDKWATNEFVKEMEATFSGFTSYYLRADPEETEVDENIQEKVEDSVKRYQDDGEYIFTYYDIIQGNRRADSRDFDDVVALGAEQGFEVASGTDLGTILDDTDDAFKALMVGAVGSSYAGALESITDTTDSTKDLLTMQMNGLHTITERGQVHTSIKDESLLMIYNTLYDICMRVIIPVAGVVLAFVFAYQIYEAVCEQNNMNSMGSGFFIQLIVRTCVVIVVILFAWQLVEAVFDIGQWIIKVTSNVVDDVIKDNDGLLNKVTTYVSENPQYNEDEVLIWTIAYYMCINTSIDFGATLAMLTQGLIINLGMYIVSVIVFVVVYVRLIEMYIHCCVAPIPLATMVNATWQQVGMNFIRSIAALALQGFIIYLCIAVFEVLVSRMISAESLLSTDFASTMWEVIGVALVMVFCLFKSSSLAKSIVDAR